MTEFWRFAGKKNFIRENTFLKKNVNLFLGFLTFFKMNFAVSPPLFFIFFSPLYSAKNDNSAIETIYSRYIITIHWISSKKALSQPSFANSHGQVLRIRQRAWNPAAERQRFCQFSRLNSCPRFPPYVPLRRPNMPFSPFQGKTIAPSPARPLIRHAGAVYAPPLALAPPMPFTCPVS